MDFKQPTNIFYQFGDYRFVFTIYDGFVGGSIFQMTPIQPKQQKKMN